MVYKFMTRSRILAQSTTTNAATTNLRHMQPVPKHLTHTRKLGIQKFKLSATKDRIKWWNIVPGDFIRVRGKEDEGIKEVMAVNKWKNWVYLKGTQLGDSGELTGERARSHAGYARHVHYSQCQLLVGQQEYSKTGEDTPVRVPLFATRVATSAPKWVGLQWKWERYAVNTTPRMSGRDAQPRIPIPWPERQLPLTPPARSIYDSPENAAQSSTYQPPTDLTAIKSEDYQTLADMYLQSFRDAQADRGALPFEVLPTNELSNPHSRAKKQKRWQELLEQNKRDRAELITAHLRDSRFRSAKEARAEAEWKFRELMKHKEARRRKERWIQRGGRERLLARNAKKVRKARKLAEKLARLELEPAPNQYIPPPPPAAPSTQDLSI
ncbi:hypothetical protein SISNIDRAFT_449089 [Sistotremastrum niveocremeum HHB9708]|uniref:KOW domain-containing protein n=2 Tax=Sistotremastraceae TaxID=3402574 RepID=A0A164Z5H9_9AGAM|nr:hypothetical protein SISNIDRAFT_449089 [Sistotremastrum niveocremeum HHB9708]KZT37670.1 hypothetical protein SISSUDRAFT_1048193 [Sistotremastrum suecicum HHB10207 ss-3]